VKNQQRWLTKKLKGDYIENDDLIRIVMFETFLHYIKEELSLMTIFAENDLKEVSVDDFFSYSWDEELKNGFLKQEEAETHIRRQKELKEVYCYIKQERPLLNKKFHETMYWSAREPIDKEINDKDQQALNTILKHRLTLWI
jgi:hypothetical protein